MEFWLKTCLLLCSYGFFKEMRPSEPLLTEYLLGPPHNLTESEVYFDVYPVWTYAYLSLLIVVFLFTDLLRYKPVIIFEALGYVATWCVLLWGGGVRWMQLMEFLYGIATSTEVAYFTYMYAQVDKQHYQKVTGYARAALLSGRFLSGVLSQVLYSTGLLDAHSLNYVSLASVSVALGLAILLPPVKTSIYFHRKKSNEPTLENAMEMNEINSTVNVDVKKISSDIKKSYNIFTLQKLKQVSNIIWYDFKEAYSSRYLLKWSIWWAFATCINLQVGNYIQPLWESISPFQETETLYNGASGAAATLLGALSAFSVGHLHLNWKLTGEVTMAAISLLDALLLIFMGLTEQIWVGYVNYVIFRVSYQALITVASYQVARELKAESYALVFGINMFAALAIQTVLTIIVDEWLEVEPGLQFVIYGSYFAVLSLFFFVISVWHLGSLGLQGIKCQKLWIKESFPSMKERLDDAFETVVP